MNRNMTIDCARAVAVLLVTAFHVWRVIGHPRSQLPLDLDLMGPLINGWAGVGLFFVISGLCMGPSTQRAFQDGIGVISYSEYFLKRFLRIALPYYVSIFIWFILINNYSIAVKPTGIFDIATHVLFIHNFWPETFYSISGVYWTLAIEMQFYLLLPLIVVFFNTLTSRLFLLVLSLFAVISFEALPSDYFLIKNSLANYIFLFIVGWMLSIYTNTVNKLFDRFPISPIVYIGFIFLLFYDDGVPGGAPKLYEACLSTLFGLSVIRLMHTRRLERMGNIGPFLAFIGKCSFSIYLYNYIFYAVKPAGNNAVAFLVLMSSVVGFGVLMYYVVEFQTEKLRKRIIRSMATNGKKKYSLSFTQSAPIDK